MKKAPFPTFDELDYENPAEKLEEFHEQVGEVDWRESPESVLKTVDGLLKAHGLEIRIYNADADSVFFDIVAK